jgi:phosphoribosylanthranilate isomerase
LDDALCAAEAGADMLGFIFYPPSPRAISVADAKALVQQLKTTDAGRRVTLVGVFVNESAPHMAAVLDEVGLDLAQLHGNETVAVWLAMRGRGFKALRGKTWRSENELWRSAITPTTNTTPNPNCPDFLLDADHETLYGGSGLRADASAASAMAREFRILLAGGLTPDNVAEAVRATRPWGVDVASGTERAPGQKDHAKVRAFISAARSI